jgi:hypothetical protein
VQHGVAHQLLVRVGHPDPWWCRDTRSAPTWCANCQGLIPLASNFWYVRASNLDGWAYRYRDYTGSGTAMGPTSSSGECSIGACSRGYKLR